MLGFRDSQSFRFSHYFVSFFSQALVVAAGVQFYRKAGEDGKERMWVRGLIFVDAWVSNQANNHRLVFRWRFHTLWGPAPSGKAASEAPFVSASIS